MHCKAGLRDGGHIAWGYKHGTAAGNAQALEKSAGQAVRATDSSSFQTCMGPAHAWDHPACL